MNHRLLAALLLAASASLAQDGGVTDGWTQEQLMRTFVKEERYVVVTDALTLLPSPKSPLGTLALRRCERDKVGDVTFTGTFTNTQAKTLTEVTLTCELLDAKGAPVLAGKPYLHRTGADATVPAGETRDFSADASRDAKQRGTQCRCAVSRTR